MTLEAIKEAITGLPDSEKASLLSWLGEQDAMAWDKQIEADFSEGGAGEALLEKWDAEVSAGGEISLDEFLAQEKAGRKPR